MLKKLLIQLEPSNFLDDVVIVDLSKIREPIVVIATMDGTSLNLKTKDELDHLIKYYSAPNTCSIGYLYSNEFTIIAEKKYVKETADSVGTK